jgi:hypothetical protein
MAVVYGGAGPNVCYTPLSSAKQNSVTAYRYGVFQRNPYKGGVTNIRAYTCVRLNSYLEPFATIQILADAASYFPLLMIGYYFWLLEIKIRKATIQK